MMLAEQTCAHSLVVAYRDAANGTRMFAHQCSVCGWVGAWLKRASLTAEEIRDAAPIDDEKRFIRGQEEWRARDEARHQQLEEDRREWRRRYESYLASDAWAERREKVLRRAGKSGLRLPTCEACASATATEVHHLTYARFGREPLFDLAAVCDRCHEDLHGE